MTKVKIDGKVYCVETLIHERERLIKEIKASAELHRLVLDKIRAEFQKELDICDDSECDMVWAVAMEFALEVIDKYREGSDKE